MGQGPIWIKKKLENRPKIKFCVCTIRPCLTVHVAPRDVHACSILSRILWFCNSTCIAVRLTKWRISLELCYFLLYMEGGCYIISSVGNGYSWYERNVMYSVCTLLQVVIWVFWPCHWWVSKKKKKLDRGWVGGLSSIQFFLDFWNFFNFAKPLIQACSHKMSRLCSC